MSSVLRLVMIETIAGQEFAFRRGNMLGTRLEMGRRNGGIRLSATTIGHFEHSAFESFVDEMMQTHKVPGICVGIVHKGDVVYLKGFGYRDLENKMPVTGNTVFGIASVTKSFTALGISQLSERGLVSIEDPVRKHLPGFNVPDPRYTGKISIHNFLTHTAGIPPLPSLNYGIMESTQPDEEEEPHVGGSNEDTKGPSFKDADGLLEFISTWDYSLLGAPGEFLSYSNDCFGLLGSIIEKASGDTYEDYLQNYILKPLGMEHTTTRIDKLEKFDEVTRLYYKDSDDNLCVSDNWQEAPAFTACGFLKSSVLDLLSYLDLYINRGRAGASPIVSPSSISRMVTPYYPYNPDQWYGYGFNVRPDYYGVTLVQHSGSLKGVASNIGYVPEKDLGVVVLSNMTGFPASKVWLGAVNLCLGLDLRTPITEKKVMPQPEARLLKFVGTYRSGEGACIRLHMVDGEIKATIDSKTYQVETTGPDTAVIIVEGVDNFIKLLTDCDGKVWALRYGSRIILRSEDDSEVLCVV